MVQSSSLMKINKAVITAAHPRQRSLPLQTVVDRDGQAKSALQIVIEEAVSAGVSEICVVVCPGDASAYFAAAGPEASRLSFIEQSNPRGYGHALWCARKFVGQEPFLHLISDHLYLSARRDQGCAAQLVEAAGRAHCTLSAVQVERESLLPDFGAVGGTRIARTTDLYQVDKVLEKPTPTQAEQELMVPGLRAGHYLTLFGIHVLTPSVMSCLDELVADASQQTIQLSDALNQLAGSERYLALEIAGHRYDIGAKYGLLRAQLALSLDGDDRDDVLTHLVELLATRNPHCSH
jgi:UTP--glucose-1-phosphate uridylyltransferase